MKALIAAAGLVVALLLAGVQPARGAWTWFSDPRVIALPGGRVLVGSVAQDGAVEATVMWGRWSHTSRLRTGIGADPDDHDNPAFLLLPDGHVLAFVTRHNASTYYVSRSVLPWVGTWFSQPVNIAPQLGGKAFSYANPVLLPDGTILLFYRGGNPPDWTMYVSQSKDGGRTWTRGQRLLGDGRPYMKVAHRGGRVDFLVTDGHPDVTPRNGVYHFYLQDGRYFNSAGDDIGEPPFGSAQLTRVSGEGSRGWVWQVTYDDAGHPLAAFQDSADNQYRLAQWAGTGWEVERIADMGEPLYPKQAFYMGGMAIASANRLYVSARHAGRTQLARYERTPEGWRVTPLGEGFRPVVVGKQVAYLTGRYTSYGDYDTRINLIPE